MPTQRYHHIIKMRLEFGIESLSDYELVEIISHQQERGGYLLEECIAEEELRFQDMQASPKKKVKDLIFFNPEVFKSDFKSNENDSNLTAKQKRALWERKHRINDVKIQPVKVKAKNDWSYKKKY